MSLHWEIEELACFALGKTEDEADEIINNGDIDSLLIDKYDIGFEQYCNIVRDLIPFTIPAKTALNEKICYGFVKDGRFIVKVEKAC